MVKRAAVSLSIDLRKEDIREELSSGDLPRGSAKILLIFIYFQPNKKTSLKTSPKNFNNFDRLKA